MRMLATVVVAVLCATGAAHADIYTWVGADGVRHYSDTPDSSRAERADLPGIQSVEGDPDALGRSLVRRRKLRTDEGARLRFRRKKHRARATTRGRRAGTRYERGVLVTMTGRRERRHVGTTRRCHLQILTDEMRLAGMAARLREPAWAR